MDVDALSRRFGPLIALHCAIAYVLHGVDIKNRSDAYDTDAFSQEGKVRIKLLEEKRIVTLPTITQTVVNNSEYVPVVENRMIVYEPPILTISSFPVFVVPPLSNFHFYSFVPPAMSSCNFLNCCR